MKTMLLRLMAVVSMLALVCSIQAQKGIETGTPFGHGDDSLRCISNTSLYSTCFDIKDYGMALKYWRIVYNECPASSKNIYIKGEAMYKELARTTGEKAYIDTALMILSQRTLYFNEGPSNDLRKSLILYDLGGNDSTMAVQSYNLIRAVSDSFPEYIDHSFSVLLMASAVKAYTLHGIDTAEVVSAYLRSSDIIESKLTLSPGDARYAAAGKSVYEIFRSSGLLTCKIAEKIYSEKIEQHPADTALATRVFNILRENKCTSTELFYRLATKRFASDRSAYNAVRLAELNLERKSIDKAIWYFSEALKLDTSKIVQSDILTRVAAMELASGKKREARLHGEDAYMLNRKNGNALFIIAEAYAGSKIGDTFDNHSVYWVAVDYLTRAKNIDPSLKAKADEKIKAYSKLFPTKEEGFYRGILDEGKVYLVGGWINEKTVIRFRK